MQKVGSSAGSNLRQAPEPCANLLAQVHARLGVLAILGNHDAGSDPHRITEFLQGKGITVLRNRSIPFEEDGHRLWLAGLDDVLEGQSDLELTLRSIPKTEPVILLATNRIVPMRFRIIQWIFNYRGIPM